MKVDQPKTDELQLLVQRCRELPPAKGNYLVNDYVENLLLTVLDYQMRNPIVEKAIDHYRERARGIAHDHASLSELLSAYPNTQDGNRDAALRLWGYGYWNRVELLRRLMAYFEGHNVTTQSTLKAWAQTADFGRDFEGKVKGAGLAIFKWLLIRQGVETIKPDTWVHRFVKDTIGRGVSDKEAVSLLEGVAAELGVKAYELDWRIWEHQSGRQD